MTNRALAALTRGAVLRLAALLASVGVAIPLGMMLEGALFRGLSYDLWTWPAIPAVWLFCLGSVAVARRAPGPGSLLLALGAAGGAWSFEPEWGLYTFGPLWLLAVGLYLAPLTLRRPQPEARAGR